jgi:hypothetical protein
MKGAPSCKLLQNLQSRTSDWNPPWHERCWIRYIMAITIVLSRPKPGVRLRPGVERRQKIRPVYLAKQHCIATARCVGAGPWIEHRHHGCDELAGIPGYHHELLERGDGRHEQVGLGEGMTAAVAICSWDSDACRGRAIAPSIFRGGSTGHGRPGLLATRLCVFASGSYVNWVSLFGGHRRLVPSRSVRLVGRRHKLRLG